MPDEPRGEGYVLVVCTGNVCRSPYAALRLRDRLRRSGSRIEVSSAGTHAMVGAPVAKEIARALSREGVDGSAWRARQLVVEDIDRAGMIVALTRDHRSLVTLALPRASRRVFTLRQLARLIDLEQLPRGPVEDPLGVLARHCAERRGLTAPSAEEDDDVVDPWGRSASTFERSLSQMRPGVAKLGDALEILTADNGAPPAAPARVTGD
jgi:protein-tyrosine phosphatase